jgi:hypothetical protein
MGDHVRHIDCFVDISLTRFDVQTLSVCSMCAFALDVRFAQDFFAFPRWGRWREATDEANAGAADDVTGDQ